MSMTRIAILVALLLSSSQRPVLEARFIGNMAFAISDGSVTVVTDFPYESGYSRYMEYSPAEIRSATASTLALITHRHRDHWDPTLFRKTNWKVVGPADVVAGLPPDRVVTLNRTATSGPVQIECVETPHAQIGHCSYIVTWHGMRLYFSGDTESPDSLLAAKSLDAAFVSPWMYQRALQRGAAIDASRIVIYHHTAGDRVPECRDRCVVPRQGETVLIRPGSSQPALLPY